MWAARMGSWCTNSERVASAITFPAVREARSRADRTPRARELVDVAADAVPPADAIVDAVAAAVLEGLCYVLPGSWRRRTAPARAHIPGHGRASGAPQRQVRATQSV